MDERRRGGPYTSLYDLCLRAGGRDLNRRVLEALIRSGACDGLGERGALLATLDRAMDQAAQVRRERDLGQASLFGMRARRRPGHRRSPTRSVTAEVPPVPAEERLRWEREHLGVFLSDHPLRRVADRLAGRIDTPIGGLGGHLLGAYVQVGGAIRDLRAFIPRRSTTGQRMAFMTLEDLTGACEVVVFARTFEECAELLTPDRVVVVRGRVQAGRNGRPGAPGSQGGGLTVTDEEDVVIPAVGRHRRGGGRTTTSGSPPGRATTGYGCRLGREQEELLPALRSLLRRPPGQAPMTPSSSRAALRWMRSPSARPGGSTRPSAGAGPGVAAGRWRLSAWRWIARARSASVARRH